MYNFRHLHIKLRQRQWFALLVVINTSETDKDQNIYMKKQNKKVRMSTKHVSLRKGQRLSKMYGSQMRTLKETIIHEMINKVNTKLEIKYKDKNLFRKYVATKETTSSNNP